MPRMILPACCDKSFETPCFLRGRERGAPWGEMGVIRLTHPHFCVEAEQNRASSQPGYLPWGETMDVMVLSGCGVVHS